MKESSEPKVPLEVADEEITYTDPKSGMVYKFKNAGEFMRYQEEQNDRDNRG